MSVWVYGILALGVLFIAFLVWGYARLARASRQHDERIYSTIAPVLERLARNEQVGAEEVESLAQIPQNRPLLYRALHEMQRIHYFPARFLDVRSQAEGQLTYWMMHPHELQDAPAAMEVARIVARDIDGESGDFVVFRYRMPEGHWSGPEWQLGLAGPYFKGSPPYMNNAGAFARAGDLERQIKPEDLVDGFIAKVRADAGVGQSESSDRKA